MPFALDSRYEMPMRPPCALALPALLALLALAAGGCSSSSGGPVAQVYEENGFDPNVVSVGVFKVVYRDVTITGAFGDGEKSTPVTVGAGTDYAYALVGYGWTKGQPQPAQLALVRSRVPVTTTVGRTVPIVLSFYDAVGKCGSVVMQEDEYKSAAAQYFPSDAVQDWASVSCPALASPDAGADGAREAGADAADAMSDATDATDATAGDVADASDAG